MTRAIDLVGKRFGKLTVLRRVENNVIGSTAAAWECQCDCGRIKISKTYGLTRGIGTSCVRCIEYPRRSKAPNSVNLIGKVFGDLTVVDKTHREGDTGAWWKVSCKCGGENIMRTSYLTIIGKTHCGCKNTRKRKVNMEVSGTQPQIGQRFGKVVVTGAIPPGKLRVYSYYVLCDCGKTHITQAVYLLRGTTTTCKDCRVTAHRKDRKTRIKDRYSRLSVESSPKWISAMDKLKQKTDPNEEYRAGELTRYLSENGVSGKFFTDRIKEFRMSITPSLRPAKIFLGIYILEECEKVVQECNLLLNK